MACPLFLPCSPIAGFEFETTPLGDLYDGKCAIDPAAPLTIDVLTRFCNVGYARGSCERAADAPADAVRFLVRGEREDGVEVAWAMERNHLPVAVGTKLVNAFDSGDADPLDCQARAYAASCLRRIGRE